MKLKIYKGNLKELGDSVSEIGKNFFGKTYSYVELDDGQIIRNLVCFSGLDGKLANELASDGDIELHVFEGGKQPMLAAMRSSAGRLYATNGFTESPPLIVRILPLSLGVLGIVTIPIFGFGLLVIYIAWKMYKGGTMMNDVKKYVNNLSGAIYI